ncbi:hypothetical protein [Stagnihabitans tardus]|nr:hypothetical protein [Stagnihabitans tardus]
MGLHKATSVAVAIAVMAVTRRAIWAMKAGMIFAAGWTVVVA